MGKKPKDNGVQSFMEKTFGSGVGLKAHQPNPTLWELSLTAEYSRPSISYDKLVAVSKFFDTNNINVRSGESRAGCDTCDHGSSYETIISVRLKENP